MKAHICFAGDHCAKEKRLAFVGGGFRLQIKAAARVRVDFQVLYMRRENSFQTKKCRCKTVGAIQCFRGPRARGIFLFQDHSPSATLQKLTSVSGTATLACEYTACGGPEETMMPGERVCVTRQNLPTASSILAHGKWFRAPAAKA